MAHYRKGAAAERELLQRFFEKGYAVARVAGSGVSPYPCPDIVAYSPANRFALECKALKSKYLNIPLGRMHELLAWSKKAESEAVIAWKVPRKGWLFLSKNHFRQNRKHYSVSLESAMKKARDFQTLIGEQTQLAGSEPSYQGASQQHRDARQGNHKRSD